MQLCADIWQVTVTAPHKRTGQLIKHKRGGITGSVAVQIRKISLAQVTKAGMLQICTGHQVLHHCATAVRVLSTRTDDVQTPA